ncbi:MAG: glutathione S-transferase family protein [Prochlorococcaceae cyanobacterium ETNP18_MAG_1]|nr:glutathione S-transferase family protein [Prochlorococcaceae cyanobacterium ETNP18_MAG_1]
MMELHQFRHSPFCLKVRMVLQAKGLSYRTVEVTPGLGQVDVFRLSGQRQVPILVDGETVLADSSVIARYLDAKQPERPLVPVDPQQAAQVHVIEDWADTTLARAGRSLLAKSAVLDADLRLALLPNELPEPLRQMIGGLPGGWLQSVPELISESERTELQITLEHLAGLVQHSDWLVGEVQSLADLAVAAQLSLLRFPASSGQPLAGKGVYGFSDHPRLQPLFQWRDRLELSLIQQGSEVF